MRVTMCSQFFIIAAALGVAHLVLPVDASGPPSTTLNASMLSAPRANRATTIDIASTTDTASTCPAVPLVPLVPEPRNRGFNSADASGDTATILGSTCVGPPALYDQCASFSEGSFYELLVGNSTNVPPSARATVRSKSSVVLGVGLAPTVGNQLCLASVSEHMIACCTDDLCDVYPCDINASSNDDDGTSSIWSSPPFFQLNSTAILADSHVIDCTMDCMLSVGSCPTTHGNDRTTLSVAESNIWHRAYNIPIHHSRSNSVDIIRGDPESRDEDHAGAYSTVSFVTTTHVEWTDSACVLTNHCANTSASCEPNDVVTVLATATALFSVFLLATDQHFPVPICVMLSLAYWSSVLWIAWGVSLVVGVTLVMAGVVCRNTVLLFPETRADDGAAAAMDVDSAGAAKRSPEVTSPPPAKKSKDNDQGTWETKCILDWNDDDTEEWLAAKKYREFLSLELTGGDTLAMCTHPMMRKAGSGQKATHLFNSVGLLIDTHKRAYKDRAEEFDFCIETRGKLVEMAGPAPLPAPSGDAAPSADDPRRKAYDFSQWQSSHHRTWAEQLRDTEVEDIAEGQGPDAPQHGLKFLKVSTGLLGMMNTITREETVLVVRHFFDSLYTAAVAPWADFPHVSSGTRVAILGTPGVGKSVFRNYVARRLMLWARSTNRRLVLVLDKASNRDNDPFVVVEQGENGDLQAAEYHFGLVKEVQNFIHAAVRSGAVVVSLVDVGNGEPPRINTPYEMVFSSPNSDIVGDFEAAKPVEGHLVLWMPMWRKVELQCAHPIVCGGKAMQDGRDDDLSVKRGCRPTLELMFKRIERFGYTARAAFKDNVSDFTEKLDAKLGEDKWTFGILDRLAQERKTLVAQASHSFIHANVPDSAVEAGSFEGTTSRGALEVDGQPLVPTLQWASRWVRAQVAAKAIDKFDFSVDATLHGDVSAGMKGEVIEDLWLERMIAAVSLGEEHKASAFRLETSLQQPLVSAGQPTSESVSTVLKGIRELHARWVFKDAMPDAIRTAAADVKQNSLISYLLRPFESTMKAIDAVIVTSSGGQVWCIHLQVTIAETHPTDGKEAASFLESLVTCAEQSGCVSVLVFVIPPKRFFKKRTFAWRGQAIELSAPKARAMVQFALCPVSSKS